MQWHTWANSIRCVQKIASVCASFPEGLVVDRLRIVFFWQDADYIIWTGDLVPHDVWSTDKAENLLIIDRLMDLMRTYFPNTPIYPTLGNHESSPVNVLVLI